MTVPPANQWLIAGPGDASLVELAPQGRARFDDDLGHLEVGPVGRHGGAIGHKVAQLIGSQLALAEQTLEDDQHMGEQRGLLLVEHDNTSDVGHRRDESQRASTAGRT
jgi:hypothetical protein